MITIIIINTVAMSNIIHFFKYSPPRLPSSNIKKFDKINLLYQNLIDSGFSYCTAFNEAMRLLLIYNPELELSDLSKKTFEIINPFYKTYNENSIDNHYHN